MRAHSPIVISDACACAFQWVSPALVNADRYYFVQRAYRFLWPCHMSTVLRGGSKGGLATPLRGSGKLNVVLFTGVDLHSFF